MTQRIRPFLMFSGRAEGGGELMPLDSDGFGPLFAWINDYFGTSWQLNLV